MILAYHNGQVVITEEENESILKIQDASKFNLCLRLRNKKYEVPYVALPIVKEAIKKVGYSCKFDDSLTKFHTRFIEHRSFLTSLKDNTYDINNPKIAEIVTFIKEQEVKIKRNCKKFKGFYGNQIDTIIYGIIGERIVIGNDIGTGKTLTSIVIAKFLMEKRGANKCLIQLPASLVTNFYNEYNTYYPDNQMMMISSQTKKKRISLYQDFKTTKRIRFLITNYEKCNFDYDELLSLSFDIIIVDEFHKMKNFKEAKRSMNFFNLIKKWNPKYRYPMSGTPIENRLFDLYPVFKLLDGGKILGGEKFFESNFIEYEERTFRVYTSPSKFYLVTQLVAVDFKNHSYVKKLISPYVIKKKLDLPAGLYSYDIIITPSKEFLRKYEEVKNSEFNVAAKYAACRQFLCDTERAGWVDNPKFDELENIISQTNEKIVIFSFFKCSIRAISKWLTERGYGNITCMGGDGQDAFDVVKRFKSDDSLRCLITTDKINYGHNIQEAKIVIEWEKPIKPTTSMQRIGRCYRSGQDKDVHAYCFVVSGTVEEIIYEQVKLKKDMIEKVVESMGTESSTSDIDEMVKDIERNVLEKFANS